MRAATYAAAGLLIAAAWYVTRPEDAQPGQQEQPEEPDNSTDSASASASDWTDMGTAAVDTINETANVVADFLDYSTGGILQISTMRGVRLSDITNPNVQAMLRVIRAGEGTADDAGYKRIFGGSHFDSFADHPRIKVKAGKWTSTAAGAYQFLASTWDETARIMGLKDFSPANQDWGAVGRMQARGALGYIKAGKFEEAVKRIAREWASLPGSPYGQPVMTWEKARTIYAAAGGEDFTAQA